jgi:hypothetical protein
MRYPFLFASLAVMLATASCDPEPKARPCAGWWRDGTWADDTVATDFTQPCRPADQACEKEPETRGWTLLAAGFTTDVGRSVRSSSLGLDACGQPVLAWSEAYAEYAGVNFNRAVVEVHRWTHGAFEPVGPQPVGTFGQAEVAVSLAMDSIGRPLVAMATGIGRPWVLAYNAPDSYAAIPLEQGLLPDSGTPVFRARALHLEVAADGQPRVAIERTYYRPRLASPPDFAQYHEVYEHGEQGWSKAPELDGADMRTLRVEAAGSALLMKGQQLMRLEDGAWRPVGPLLPEGVPADMQLDADGRPVVLLSVPAPTGGGRFDLVELADSGAWEARAGPLIGLTRHTLARAQLRLEPGTGLPVVAWGEHTLSSPQTYGIRVLRWTGGQWEPVGGGAEVHAGDGSVYGVDLELDGTGRPTVAWHAEPGPSLFLARYRP